MSTTTLKTDIFNAFSTLVPPRITASEALSLPIEFVLRTGRLKSGQSFRFISGPCGEKVCMQYAQRSLK